LTTFVTLGIMERFGELSLLLLCYHRPFWRSGQGSAPRFRRI
jgi:hypothetical protein